MTKSFMFALAMAMPAIAAAQPGSSDAISDVRSEAWAHVGPFYLTPRLLLKELGVDSNVFNEAGEQKSDFTVTLTPKLDVWVPMARRALLKTTVAPDLVWYAEYATERSVNPNLSARGELYLNRITLFGEQAYVNTRQRPNHDVDVRSRHVEDAVTTGVDVAFTPKLSLEVAARKADIRYDADAEFDGTPLQRTLNRETRGLQLTARHRVTPLTTLAVRYDIREDRFSLSSARDSDSYRVMPGVEFAPQALVKGTAYVGYRKFTPSFAEELPAFSGIVADLGLSYTLLGATVFGARYGRDLTYSYSEAQPFFVENTVGASIRHALGRRFDIMVSGDRHHYQYQNSLTAALDLVPRIDTTWIYAASLGCRVGREGRLGFGVTHVQRQSTVQGREYDNLRFGGSFSYGF